MCHSFTLLPHMWRVGCCHDKQASSVDSHKIKQRTQASQGKGKDEYEYVARSGRARNSSPAWHGLDPSLMQLKYFCNNFARLLGKFTFSYAAICNKKLSTKLPPGELELKLNLKLHCAALDSGSFTLQTEQAWGREGWLCAASASN